jgi:hypothetical protein
VTPTPVYGWAIKHWNGGFYIDTVRRTRAEAIAAFVERFVPEDSTWRKKSICGIHRTVRVTITESRKGT